MRVRLTIGVVSSEPGVRILLGQLGVAYEQIGNRERLDPADYSVILINRPLDSEQLRRIDEYLKRGGAALDTGHFLPRIHPGRFGRKKVVRIAPKEDPLFPDLWLADLDARLLLDSDAQHLDGIVGLHAYGDGWIAYIPFDIDRMITDARSERKLFYSPYSRDANEIVALVSKGEIRKIVERGLWWLHERRAIPYLHLWYFPEELESIFCYRIDSDYGTRGQVDALYDAARRQGIGMTWFLHVGAHAEWLDRFRSFEGQELAIHGFRHKTFRRVEENRANIDEAVHLLRGIGVVCTGYAAPNGFWHQGVARAAESFGFDYSSEFSFDYDNLPSHPWLLGEFVRALQVPIHPICIGSLLRVKASREGMKRYFRWIIDRKLQAEEPVILYHHPGHEHAEVMEDSFIRARELGLVNMTMGEYARWWKGREHVRFEASWEDGMIEIRSNAAEQRSVRLSLRDPSGGRCFLSDGRWRIGELEPRPRRAKHVETPGDLARIRRFDPLLVRHAIEDFNARARQ